MKNPYLEDLEYCEKDFHTFIMYEDGRMKCNTCNIDFKEWLEKKNKK